MWDRGAWFAELSLLDPLAESLGLSVLDLVRGHPALTALTPAPEGLDDFWWAEDTYYQYILARAGREVVFLEYEGETDLREKGAYFASLLGAV